MGTLNGFINEVVAELQTIEGIMQASGLVDKAATWPFVPVTASNGDIRQHGDGTVTYLHNVQVGLLGTRQDIAVANEVILPKLETIVEALYEKMVASTNNFTDIQTFGEMNYTFGPVDWGGVVMFGFILEITNVKIQNLITI
jgi:hypothetical protein